MPKITQLNAISRANIDPANDVLPIVDASADETDKATVNDLVNAASPTRLNISSALDTTLRVVKDNAVTPASSQLYLATNKSAFSGKLSIGQTAAPVAVADIAGTGTTSGTQALWVQNATPRTLLKINDDSSGQLGDAVLGSTFTIYPQTFFVGDSYLSKIGPPNGAASYLPFVDYNSGQNIMRMYQGSDRRLGISDANTFTAAGSALLELNSTAKGLLFSRMTTVQKNAISGPVAGLVVYDSTLNKLCVYTGAAWETVTSV